MDFLADEEKGVGVASKAPSKSQGDDRGAGNVPAHTGVHVFESLLGEVADLLDLSRRQRACRILSEQPWTSRRRCARKQMLAATTT